MDTKKLLPCPFCGSSNIRMSEAMYLEDDGEYPGVECIDCGGMKRLEYWNKRSGAGAPLPDSIQEALNSGDGIYRP